MNMHYPSGKENDSKDDSGSSLLHRLRGKAASFLDSDDGPLPWFQWPGSIGRAGPQSLRRVMGHPSGPQGQNVKLKRIILKC